MEKVRNRGDRTREWCGALRGIAILVVITHNFLHVYPGILKENEQTFEVGKVQAYLDVLMHPGLDVVAQLVSFLLPYILAVYLFLSGYGLVRSYENQGRHRGERALTFCVRHYLKLLKLVFPAIVMAGVLYALHSDLGWHFTWKRAVLQSLFLTNYFPYATYLYIYVPWWFLGMILQVYVIYRLVMYAPPTASVWRRYVLPVGIGVACCLLMRCISPEGLLQQWLHYNCVGHMLGFVGGVITARCEHDVATGRGSRVAGAICTVLSLDTIKRHDWRLDLLLVVVALAAMLSFQLTFDTWVWIDIPGMVGGCALVRLLGRRLLVPLAWLGKLSAAIYIIHPFLRKALIFQLGNMWLAFSVFVVLTMLAAMAYQWILQRYPNRI